MVSLLVALQLLACLGAEPAPSSCWVEGVVPQHAGGAYQIRIAPDLTNDWQGHIVAQGVVTADGGLRAEFPLDEPQPAHLMVGRTLRVLWLVPGRLTFRSADREWTFDGAGAFENRLLEATGLGRPGVSVPQPDTFDPDTYAALVDERANEQRAICEAQQAVDSGSRGPFHAYVNAQIIGQAANAKATYPLLASMQGLVDLSDVPAAAYEFWNSFPLLDDTAALRSPAYRQALDSCFEYRAAGRLRVAGVDPTADRDAWILEQLEVQREALKKHPQTDELLFACKVDFMIQYASRTAAEQAIEGFRSRFPKSQYADVLETRYRRSAAIDARALAEEISFIDSKGAPCKLADLKGRIVYVDFWGSWCRACLVLVPALKELAADLEGGNGIILGINMHDDHETWRATLRTKGLPGMQWKPATEEDEARLTELVHLRAYPRFVLLGREGEVLTSAAPPPGDALPVIRKAMEGP